MTDIDALEKLAKAATPGEWVWWTSCSWRRLRSRHHGRDVDVIGPYVCRDGHPDCEVSREDMEFIAGAQPDVVLALISEIRKLREALAIAVSALEKVDAQSRDIARVVLAQEDAQ